MADPATVGLIVKGAITALSDKRIRKSIGWIIVAILSPVIVITVVFCLLISGAADHNNSALDLAFNGGMIGESMSEEYTIHIEDMQDSFSILDEIIDKVGGQMEGSNSLDSIRVKAIFYSLFFGADNPKEIEHQQYVGCFVTYEKRLQTVKNKDGTTDKESYTVAVPIKNLPQVYENIEAMIGKNITCEDIANASEIYYRVSYGKFVPTYGIQFDDFINGLPLSEVPFIGVDGFCSPVGDHWRQVVTSEFGYRKDPFTGQAKGHGGIDLGLPKGTPIYAALDGIVLFVSHSNSGFGHHVIVDHGGGFITLYAHCSKILVIEGEDVSAGDKIAEVGSTGRSTGNHLHFEIRINGIKQNPRSYLP